MARRIVLSPIAAVEETRLAEEVTLAAIGERQLFAVTGNLGNLDSPADEKVQLARPMKTFRTESLAQRLRPAKATELPDAPQVAAAPANPAWTSVSAVVTRPRTALPFPALAVPAKPSLPPRVRSS